MKSFANKTKSITHSSEDVSISIHFSKDRIKDITKGRFVDQDLSLLGYEWPHILTCLSLIIPEKSFSEYLEKKPCQSNFDRFFHHELGLTRLDEFTKLGANIDLKLHAAIDNANGNKERFILVESQSFKHRIDFHPVKKEKCYEVSHRAVYKSIHGQNDTFFISDNHFENSVRMAIKHFIRPIPLVEMIQRNSILINRKIIEVSKFIKHKTNA
ncbi:MAG: hypothetical protein ACPGJV_13265 [Bacteriovoracaceae bacterium]